MVHDNIDGLHMHSAECSQHEGTNVISYRGAAPLNTERIHGTRKPHGVPTNATASSNKTVANCGWERVCVGRGVGPEQTTTRQVSHGRLGPRNGWLQFNTWGKTGKKKWGAASKCTLHNTATPKDMETNTGGRDSTRRRTRNGRILHNGTQTHCNCN